MGRESVGDGAFKAKGTDAVGNGVEGGRGGFGKGGDGCFAVDGVDHHFLGSDEAEGFEPRLDEVVGGVGDVVRVGVGAREEHGLDDDVAMEVLEPLDDGIDVVGGVGAVNDVDEVGVDGVELQNVVIDAA